MSDIGVGRQPTPPDLPAAARPPVGTPAAPPPAPPVPGAPQWAVRGERQGAPGGSHDTSIATADSGRTEVAAEQAREVASTAAAGARDVAGEMKTQAGQVADEARYQARHLVHETRRELHGQAAEQTDRAAERLRGVAGQIQALRQGRPEEAGAVGEYVAQLGDKAQELADRLQTRGFDGVMSDVRRFARRRPGTFLAGAAMAGFVAGRMIRSSVGTGESDPRPSGHHYAEGQLGPAGNPVAGYGPDAYGWGPEATAAGRYGPNGYRDRPDGERRA